ncbi:alpha-amylase family glycosyl hydrolase [Gottschalkiaceae bacterium SANA]|nr:alpha-amylase family glycosyl hydrolase [Gottschalkiaceae bacterium SANA]
MDKTIIYEVFVRNHSKEGNFEALIPDLERIKELGVDVVWLMPIHPIGKVNRKGILGSPYSISDYRKINPELGSLDDFQVLLAAIHSEGMKCMIDVVYNHTSHDAIFTHNHPEYYYRTPENRFGNKIADWSDIIDLDFQNLDLQEELIDILCYWRKMGVDGFRCDVASLVPVSFWLKAKEQVDRVEKGTLWLAESVHAHFLQEVRNRGFYAASDAELYQAFDITYDYDIHHAFEGYFNGKNDLSTYLDALSRQGAKNPTGARKLRFLENHDQPRAAYLLPDLNRRKNWLAFHWMLPGDSLIYAGEERGATHQPTLFDRDPIPWERVWDEGEAWFKKLTMIESNSLAGAIRFVSVDIQGICVLMKESEEKIEIGVFNLEQKIGKITLPYPVSGHLEDLYTNQAIELVKGTLSLQAEPIRFIVKKDFTTPLQ